MEFLSFWVFFLKPTRRYMHTKAYIKEYYWACQVKHCTVSNIRLKAVSPFSLLLLYITYFIYAA